MDEKKFKRISRIAVLLTIIVTVIIYILGARLIEFIIDDVFMDNDLQNYVNEQTSFYGEEAMEASSHKPSKAEREVGEELVELAETCFMENRTDDRLGKLNNHLGNRRNEGYYLGLEFSTCKIDGDKGVVWVLHSEREFDKENLSRKSGHSFDSMALMIELQNGQWVITDTKCMP